MPADRGDWMLACLMAIAITVVLAVVLTACQSTEDGDMGDPMGAAVAREVGKQ